MSTDIKLPPSLRGRVGVGGQYRTPLLNNARQLRNNMTEAERFLWRHLLHKQLAGVRFRRQFPIDRYIVDFVCLEKRLIIELDGGQHQRQEAYDVERDAYLSAQGFRVLRFWNDVVFKETDAVLNAVLSALNAPHPNPPPQGGGEHAGIAGEQP